MNTVKSLIESGQTPEAIVKSLVSESFDDNELTPEDQKVASVLNSCLGREFVSTLGQYSKADKFNSWWTLGVRGLKGMQWEEDYDGSRMLPTDESFKLFTKKWMTFLTQKFGQDAIASADISMEE